MKSTSPSNLLQKGFTLVETVLAVGIVAFAFVGIAGLLPCGMQSFRRAMDNTMQAQMTQNIVAQAGQVPFASLSSQFNGKNFLFDDNGGIVESSNPQSTYMAHVQLTSQTDVPGTSSYTNPGLAQLTITYYRAAAQNGEPLGKTVTYIANKAGDLAE